MCCQTSRILRFFHKNDPTIDSKTNAPRRPKNALYPLPRHSRLHMKIQKFGG